MTCPNTWAVLTRRQRSEDRLLAFFEESEELGFQEALVVLRPHCNGRNPVAESALADGPDGSFR
jgi:hypothetical protein